MTGLWIVGRMVELGNRCLCTWFEGLRNLWEGQVLQILQDCGYGRFGWLLQQSAAEMSRSRHSRWRIGKPHR